MRTIQRINTLVVSIITLLIFSSIACADAGVPMIFITFPAMCAALVPIIVIEAWVLRKFIPLPFWKSLAPVGIANLISTLFGVPLTWGVLTGLEILLSGGRAYGLTSLKTKILAVTLQAPWLIPYETDLHWMIPLASLVLLIPFFFVSWMIEYHTASKLLSVNRKDLRKAMFVANIVSYSLLALTCVSFFIAALVKSG